MWIIDDISKPYALCVTREQADKQSEFVVNIFGTKEFDLFEIDDSEIGKSAKKYCLKNNDSQENRFFNFPEIKQVDQPIKFDPKKINKKSYFDESTENHNHKQNFQETGNIIEELADSNLKNETIKQADDLNNGEESMEKMKAESKCCILI